VRRGLGFLVRNWPLKLGALLLATVLYGGLVLSQNVRVWTGVLPVDAIRPPAGAVLLSVLDPVTQVRYRAPLDVGVVSPDSFSATVDLSRVDAQTGGPAVPVPVTVIALKSGIQVVDYEPRTLQVRLDPVETRQMAVTVNMGAVPEGLSIGTAQVDPPTVTVRGASSGVAAIQSISARVTIDASALNVDQQVDAIPIDAAGNQVPNVEVEPSRVRVRIPVARELANRTLPVVPQLTGELPAGYRIDSIRVEPLSVTVSGEAATVGQLESAPTEPIDLTGRTAELDTTVALALPEGISVSGSELVHVVIVIAAQPGSATFDVAIVLDNRQPDMTYTVTPNQLNVILTGPQPILAGLDPQSLLVHFDVADLEAGTHELTPVFTAPARTEVFAVTPTRVTVVVAPSPSE
jgi:YbbR domain-containing protein